MGHLHGKKHCHSPHPSGELGVQLDQLQEKIELCYDRQKLIMVGIGIGYSAATLHSLSIEQLHTKLPGAARIAALDPGFNLSDLPTLD